MAGFPREPPTVLVLPLRWALRPSLPVPEPSDHDVPKNQHSAILHLSPGPEPRPGSPRPRRVHPAAPLSAVLIGLLAACGGDEEPVPEDAPVVLDERTQQTLDEMFPGTTDAELARLRARPRIESVFIDFESHAEGLPTGGTWREHPTLADFDGDGDLDLVATNRKEDGINVWRNEGGRWTPAIEGLPRDLMYGGTSAADLDEDGDLDLVFGAHQDPGLHVFFNDGDMNWTLKPLEGIQSDALLLDVATGDLNGDGHLDVAGIGQFEGGVAVHLGDGKGGLTRVPTQRALTDLRRGTQVEFADIDEDGLDDLVVVSDRGLRVLFTRLDEGASFPRFEDLSEGLPRPAIGNSLRGVAIADFDEDGDLDLASGCIADPSDPVDEWNVLGLYRRNGDGSWEQFDRGLERRMAQHDVVSADLDLDGHLDLFCITANSHAVLWRGDGTGAFEVMGQLPLPGASAKVAVADVNGDGRPDVAMSAGGSKAAPDAAGVVVWINDAGALERAAQEIADIARAAAETQGD